nr:MAG TPA: TRX family protein [Caudoviricetes sp.]
MNKIIKINRYWATWCSHCHAFAPIFEEVSKNEKYKDIEFNSLDVEDDGSDDAVTYSIRNLPTTIIFGKDNKVLRKVIGNVTLKQFEEIIDDVNS